MHVSCIMFVACDYTLTTAINLKSMFSKSKDIQQIVPLTVKGCRPICRFEKWQIHPFHIKGDEIREVVEYC